MIWLALWVLALAAPAAQSSDESGENPTTGLGKTIVAKPVYTFRDTDVCPIGVPSCFATCKLGLLPDWSQCDTWKCMVYCAATSSSGTCIYKASALCHRNANDAVIGAGPECDVNCNPAYTLFNLWFVIFQLILLF
eukprot:GEMP01035711.1.p1 GENE.GEMP01035711.1~~GEMP01035711.1.p1  ORF type:complete len:136 (-),score=12.29 GEMP01035711.1:1562-1969(-)